MGFEIPEDCRYAETHEWVRSENGAVRVGITAFARDELGDVVFVDLPTAGERVEAGSAFGVVESVKAVSDLYAPLSGEVTAINDTLFDTPELVNEDPFGDGWMIEIDPADGSWDDTLLSPVEYGSRIE